MGDESETDDSGSVAGPPMETPPGWSDEDMRAAVPMPLPDPGAAAPPARTGEHVAYGTPGQASEGGAPSVD